MTENTINVDNSTLMPVAICTSQTALKALGYRGKEQGEALDVGSSVHDGLMVFFEGGDYENAFDVAWEGYFPPERMIDRDNYQYRNVRDIFTTYCERHPLEGLPFEVLETEKMVGMPLSKSGKIWFWMKRDLKVLDKVTGSVVPLDHKTTAWSIGNAWQKKWRMASQLTGYIWATQMEEGRHCPFAYVNAIQINKLPNSSARCAKHKMKYSECRLEHTAFSLLTYNREAYQLEQWKRDALMLGVRYAKVCESYPDLESIVHAPCEGVFINGACDWCEFNKFCRLGKNVKFADGLLTQGKWEPWKNEDGKRIDWR